LQLRLLQVGLAQLGIVQIRAFQVGGAQIGAPHARSFEVRALQVSVAQVGLFQVGPAQIPAGQLLPFDQALGKRVHGGVEGVGELPVLRRVAEQVLHDRSQIVDHVAQETFGCRARPEGQHPVGGQEHDQAVAVFLGDGMPGAQARIGNRPVPAANTLPREGRTLLACAGHPAALPARDQRAIDVNAAHRLMYRIPFFHAFRYGGIAENERRTAKPAERRKPAPPLSRGRAFVSTPRGAGIRSGPDRSRPPDR